MHRTPFATSRWATNVRERPSLALDRMAWNKVFRRDFWDAESLEFPPILYEDYPVTIRRMYALRRLMSSIDRYTTGVSATFMAHPTQRSSEVSNIRDRVESDLYAPIVHGTAPSLTHSVSELFAKSDLDAILSATLSSTEPAAARSSSMPNGFDALHPAVAGSSSPLVRYAIALADAVSYPSCRRISPTAVYAETTTQFQQSRWRRGTYVVGIPRRHAIRDRIPQSTFALSSDQLSMWARIEDLQWSGIN